MVRVRGFQGYVAEQQSAGRIMAPPYDVINRKEAHEMAKDNEKSFLHVNKPEIDLPFEVDEYDKQVYIKGRENLVKFVKNGWLIKEQIPIMYVYAQTRDSKTQYGIVLEASVQDYTDNIIKKHELTRKDKEQDRTNLCQIQGANAGPVFLTYSDNQNIDAIVAEVIKQIPHINDEIKEFDSQGRLLHNTLNTMWKCNQTFSQQLQKHFQNEVKYFYIADGHHRAASACNVGMLRRQKAIQEGVAITGDENFNYFMAIVYPQSQVTILRYNRVVKDLNGQTKEQILQQISQKFDIYVPYLNIKETEYKGEFAFYIQDHWYHIKLKKQFRDNSTATSDLCVELLSKYILSPIFGIDDLRTSKRIEFQGGIHGLDELQSLCQKNNYACAFSPTPVTMLEIMNVAEHNLIMPPKSTWFEPKPRSGLIVRIMDEIQ